MTQKRWSGSTGGSVYRETQVTRGQDKVTQKEKGARDAAQLSRNASEYTCVPTMW